MYLYYVIYKFLIAVAPSISATPISQTVLERDMRTVEFSCTAPGDPQPTIAWLTSNMVDVLLLGNERLEVRKGSLINALIAHCVLHRF